MSAAGPWQEIPPDFCRTELVDRQNLAKET